jgi:hypothetical protein
MPTAISGQLYKNNLDGILSFFHILMTRDRIPVIDYGGTFNSSLTDWFGSSIVLQTSATSAYEQVKQKAFTRLAENVLNLPKRRSLDLDRDRLSFGYFWTPGLEPLPVAPDIATVAQFVLGGLIFGEYARAAAADHVLQSKRLYLLTTLDKETEQVADNWYSQEWALFAAIAKISDQDRGLRATKEKALPSVVLHLLAQGARSPRGLLDDALKLRDSNAGKSYRVFHKRLREAWRLGRRDADAETQIKAVAEELKRRITGKPTILTRVVVNGSLKANARAGIGTESLGAHITAGGSITIPKTIVPVAIPRGVRNWFVDNVMFSSHQKLLLHMARDQHSFENVAKGLYNVWQKG